MTRTRTVLIISLALVWVAVPRHCGGEELPSCNGKFKGKWVSRTELTEILKQHEAWLKDSSTGDLDDLPETALGSNDPRRANLCDASVFDGYLSGADLRGANLSGANLGGGNLTRANLEYANLSGAHLYQAELTDSNLRRANLSGANLEWAKLPTMLLEANLRDANLRGADLTDVKLGGADLYDADLADAYLDFDPDSLPKLSSHLEYAKNLQYVRFRLESAALVRLRSEFKDLGLRSQETQLNYAIRRSEMSLRGINGQHVHG